MRANLINLPNLTALLALLCQLTFVSIYANSQILSPPSPALDRTTSIPIRTLLTEQWERDPRIALASKRTFEAANSHSGALLVAYTVNRLRHNRTDDAKLAVRELTDRHPGNLDGWVFKMWLNTLTDDFDAALVNMRSLKKQIDKHKNLPPSTQQTIFKRVGRLIGYMQGPVANRINDELLNDTIGVISNGLTPELLKLFNVNRLQVLQDYDDLVKVQSQQSQVELAKVKIANDAEAVALEREVQLLEKTESQLLPERQRIRDDGSKQISAIERQGQSVEQQRNQISSDILATELDLRYLYQDLFLAQQQPPRFRVSTFNLQNQIRNAEFALNSLRANGVQSNNQLNSLQSQLINARNGTNNRLRAIDKEIKRVNGAKRRNLGKLARIAKGPKVADGKRESWRSRAAALRTYDELSLELYRQDILDQLTK